MKQQRGPEPALFPEPLGASLYTDWCDEALEEVVSGLGLGAFFRACWHVLWGQGLPFVFSSASSLGKRPVSNCLENSPCLPVLYSNAGASLSSSQAGLKTAA